MDTFFTVNLFVCSCFWSFNVDLVTKFHLSPGTCSDEQSRKKKRFVVQPRKITRNLMPARAYVESLVSDLVNNKMLFVSDVIRVGEGE